MLQNYQEITRKKVDQLLDYQYIYQNLMKNDRILYLRKMNETICAACVSFDISYELLVLQSWVHVQTKS